MKHFIACLVVFLASAALAQDFPRPACGIQFHGETQSVVLFGDRAVLDENRWLLEVFSEDGRLVRTTRIQSTALRQIVVDTAGGWCIRAVILSEVASDRLAESNCLLLDSEIDRISQ